MTLVDNFTMEMNESKEVLSWNLCRIFNKEIYYSIRTHVMPSAERKRCSYLSSDDIFNLFTNFYTPSGNKPKENPFIVLKILKVHKLQTIKESEVQGLQIDAKILKTADTRKGSSAERSRVLRATGSLAKILHACLKIADLLVIAKDHRVPEKLVTGGNTSSSDPWKELKTTFKILLNNPCRQNTQIFLYRHDGKFNYRGWMKTMEEIVAQVGAHITVDRFDSTQHGSCIAITPTVYKNQFRDDDLDSLFFDLNDLDTQDLSGNSAAPIMHEFLYSEAWHNGSQELGHNLQQINTSPETGPVEQGVGLQEVTNSVPKSPPHKRLKLTWETQVINFDSEPLEGLDDL